MALIMSAIVLPNSSQESSYTGFITNATAIDVKTLTQLKYRLAL
jgi:hypothetical protein